MTFKEKTWYACTPKADEYFGRFHIMYVYYVAEDNQDDLDQHIYNSTENDRHGFNSDHQLSDFDNVEISEKVAKKYLKLWGY